MFCYAFEQWKLKLHFGRCLVFLSFYLSMLKGKGAPSFRTRLLEMLIEEGENDKDITKGKNSNLNKDIVVQFFGMAYVGVVEWWILNGMPYPTQVMAEQVGVLLERNL
ncbi:TetR-like C-terminal domain-containing protein [Marinicrinis lubricantis]|uniref:TetR-like C-terminal domain-containing protein n=2 Tax=Marinicrinis lubricantis TaxID=2086470 RepID=A0ABW1IN98_9BACL